MNNSILGSAFLCSGVLILFVGAGIPGMETLWGRDSDVRPANFPIQQNAKIVASDGAAFDHFGFRVAISGDTAIVGAPDDESTRGAAYVIVRNGSSWTQQAKLIAPDGAAGDNFGIGVALSSDMAIVGTYGHNYNQRSAYVFVRNGSSWTLQSKLTPSNGSYFDHFGAFIAFDGTTAVLGAYGDDDSALDAGAAYVFVRNGSTWTQQAKLVNPEGATSEGFGNTVALSGDTVIVGVPYDSDQGYSSGSAYVFVRNGASWIQQAKLTAPDGAEHDYFGLLVSLDRETAVVAAPGGGHRAIPGSVYVFGRSGGTWTLQTKLTASDGGLVDRFGCCGLSLSGSTLIIGAYWDDDKGADSGSAYVFTRTGNTWSERAKLMPTDGAQGDQFGYSIAMSGGTIVLTAPTDDDKGIDSGSAYIFGLNQSPIALCSSLTVVAGPACKADVSINNGSFDPDGDAITLAQTPPGPYPLGATPVALTVTDGNGASSQCPGIATVLDATAPSIAGVSVDKPILWPPNHKMADVTVSYSIADNCNLSACTLSVASDEPVNGTGDGDTAPDWAIIDAHRVRLRAERAGNGNGRTYTLLIGCADTAGNRSTQAVTVTVPHSH